MLGYLCVLLIVKAVVILLSWEYFSVLKAVVVLSRGMLGYLCVLLMVKAVVILLSWDVRLPLCIVDSQSCSSAALVGC